MERREFFRLLAGLGVVSLAPGVFGACGRDDGGGVSVAEAKADVDRARPDSAANADAAVLAHDNLEFAWALYHQLPGREGNVFFSPYSISQALAMVYAGAKGATADEMAAALSFRLPAARVHPAFNALARGLEPDSDDVFRLAIANSAWGQAGKHFEDAYLETLARYYGAGLQLTDFAARPEPSRVAINEWVEEHTERLIKDLLPRGSITSLTRLVLANAIYFKGDWETPFEKERTSPGEFTRLDGSTAQAEMMHGQGTLRAARADGVTTVELPYKGGSVSMLVLVPDAGTFDRFVAGMDAAALGAVEDALRARTVALALPKFEFSYDAGLRPPLEALGMTLAFTPDAADLSGMDGTRELYVSDVVHKAFVRVDEKGTEAAAATGVIVGATSAPTDVLEVTVDRPFLFLIRDGETGAALFVGQVTDAGA